MNRRLLAVLFLALPACAYAQATADAPNLVVGDRWEFRQAIAPDGKTAEWSREIVEIGGDGVVKVKLESGNVGSYDRALNPVSQDRADEARVLVKYPLQVGAEWTFRRRFANLQTEETGKAKVVARETLQVPAGSFDCYRIEAEATVARRSNPEQRSWTRWYCPEIKWIAKEILVEWAGYPPRRTTATSELLKFTPAQ